MSGFSKPSVYFPSFEEAAAKHSVKEDHASERLVLQLKDSIIKTDLEPRKEEENRNEQKKR